MTPMERAFKLLADGTRPHVEKIADEIALAEKRGMQKVLEMWPVAEVEKYIETFRPKIASITYFLEYKAGFLHGIAFVKAEIEKRIKEQK